MSLLMSNPADGAIAIVEPDDVDRWKVRGWQPADKPADTEMIWMHNATTDGRAKCPLGVVEQWRALGWELSAPPEPVDLTKDRRFTDQPANEPAAKAPTKSARTGRQTQTEE